MSDADFFELVDGVEKFAASEIAKLRFDFAKFTTEVNEKIENFGKRLSNQENRVEDIKAEVQSMDKKMDSFGDPKAEAKAVTQKALGAALSAIRDGNPYPTSSPIPSTSLAEFRW